MFSGKRNVDCVLTVLPTMTKISSQVCESDFGILRNNVYPFMIVSIGWFYETNRIKSNKTNDFRCIFLCDFQSRFPAPAMCNNEKTFFWT